MECCNCWPRASTFLARGRRALVPRSNWPCRESIRSGPARSNPYRGLSHCRNLRTRDSTQRAVQAESRGSGVGYSSPQSSQRNVRLNVRRHQGRPSNSKPHRGRRQQSRPLGQIDENLAGAVAISKRCFERFAEPLRRRAAGRKPVDDDNKHVSSKSGRTGRRTPPGCPIPLRGPGGRGSLTRSIVRPSITARTKPSSRRPPKYTMPFDVFLFPLFRA